MPRVHFVKCARKPNAVVSKQDIEDARSGKNPDAASFYWWKFRYGGKRFKKTRPRGSELTQSEYLSNIYSIQEEVDDADPVYEDLSSWVDELRDRVQEIADEQRDKRENMPENLQDSYTGCLLEERADCCDNVVSELGSIDIPEGEYADEESDPEPDEDDKSTWGDDEDYETAHDNWTFCKEEWENEKVAEVKSAVSDAVGNLE